MEQLIAKHFIQADDLNTKQTICRRMVEDMFEQVNSDVCQVLTTQGGLLVHPENMKFIDEKWKAYIELSNFQLTGEESVAYQLIKMNDFVSAEDLKKFVAAMIKRETVDKKSKIKVLNSNDLNILLAVDGFEGHAIPDFKQYVEHLKYGPGDNEHVDSVRNLYRHDLLKKLNGEMSARVVFLVVLRAYEKFVHNDKIQHAIRSKIEELTKTLLNGEDEKHREIYHKDVENVLQNVDSLVQEYLNGVSRPDQIAPVKCNTLYQQYSKKHSAECKKSPAAQPKKKGRAKKDPGAGLKDLEKKRPRKVRALKSESESSDEEAPAAKRSKDTSSDDDDEQ